MMIHMLTEISLGVSKHNLNGRRMQVCRVKSTALLWGHIKELVYAEQINNVKQVQE